MDKNYKILVADDSESYLKIIQQIFEIVGYKYELVFARNGKEACELALKKMPDLIILDVIMPEMNGIEAAKFIKSNEFTQDIPIIVLSATESLKAAYEVGASDFISKPFNQYELLIKVRSALNLVSKIKIIKSQSEILNRKAEETFTTANQDQGNQSEIPSDLKYSKRIQKSILPTREKLDTVLGDYFIYDLPRDFVSGDFYWVGELNNKKVIAVGDCTGHGIPAALMTMAGIAFLNNILGRNIDYTPAQILLELRLMVMNLLKQKSEEEEATDGIDISIIIIDEAELKLQFAGANNPIYIIKNGELEIIKGDRMPIGVNLNFERSFTDVELNLEKDDLIYMFSDGFADQFGGPRNKKFRYKNFQELLLEVHLKPFDQQKEIISKSFLDWKGKQKQLDDVLVLGLKL